MRISDWSSDVCSSDLDLAGTSGMDTEAAGARHVGRLDRRRQPHDRDHHYAGRRSNNRKTGAAGRADAVNGGEAALVSGMGRSEEHTSELQSLMRISYAVFCLKKKMIISRYIEY